MKAAISMLALAGGVLAADLPSITMKGSKFFFPNGTQFFMKGVAYQQETAAAGATADSTLKYVDPLADEASCKRDIPLLAELGTNTIRTYAVNPKADHSVCMKLLQQHGIYVVSDLSEPATSINRDDPQWNTELFSRYKAVVDELGKYSNVIGFFAGNEVSNNATNTGASAYVKAAVRDTKKYIKENSSRWMGVGYAANDDKDIRKEIADYFNCGATSDSIDFWGYNIYSWCGENTMQGSGYSDQVTFFEKYSVPVFFAEYGCNLPSGAADRIFQETAALYSDDMTPTFSGGIVYMYFQEANDYGLVKVTGSSVSKLKDFNALKKQVLKADPKGVHKDDYSATLTPASCPKITKTWQAAEQLPPTPDETLCECMVSSLECVVDTEVSEKKYGDLFGSVCGEDKSVCAGINGNPKVGNYGAYSMCKPAQKLAYVLDAYYQKQNKASDACSWKGMAKLQKAKAESSCKKGLDAAAQQNEQIATATTAVDSPSSTGDSSSTDDESFGVRGASMTNAFSFGGVAVGLYSVAAALVGIGMIAL